MFYLFEHQIFMEICLIYPSQAFPTIDDRGTPSLLLKMQIVGLMPFINYSLIRVLEGRSLHSGKM